MNSILSILFILVSTSSYALDLNPIDQSKDRNFNGIVRGMGVFQSILEDDYNAVNERGMIEIEGDFTPVELVTSFFKESDVRASYNLRGKPTVLDRGYINDGSTNPRIPEKLAKVVDMYNQQIMGLVRGHKKYRLILFDMNSGELNRKGWIIFNTEHSQALWASSDF